MLAVPTPQLAIPYRGFRNTGAMAARDGYVFAASPRDGTGALGTAATSGTLYLQLARVMAGDTVSSLTFFFVGANSSATHWYFALYDASRALLGQTADQTSTAISANSLVTLNLVTPVTFSTDQNIYVGVMQVASGTSSILRAAAAATNILAASPIVFGTSDTGLSSGTAPANAAAITGVANTSVWCAGA
jgi:hypothetical protein